MEFNPFSYETQADPYPVYRWLRDAAPCYRHERLGFFAISRFQDCWDAALDWRTFSSSAGPSMELEADGELYSIIGMDPPRHTSVRNLLSRGFTARRIQALEPRIRAITRGHLARALRGSAAEFQALLGAVLPMQVICELVGIPLEMAEQIVEWANLSLHREPDRPEPPPEAAAADLAMRSYLRGLLQERKHSLGNDLLSILIQAELTEGGEKLRLGDEEIVAFLNLLAAAGNETTAKLLGNAIVLLAQHPEQRAALVADPSRIPQAIEECLRFEPPSQNTGRLVLRDTELHGVKIPTRSRVMFLTGAACRDEREYPDPDRFDIGRSIKRSLYFGHGHHVCLGKSLARLEAKVVLEEVLARFPYYEIESDGLERTHQSHVRGYSRIPIRL